MKSFKAGILCLIFFISILPLRVSGEIFIVKGTSTTINSSTSGYNGTPILQVAPHDDISKTNWDNTMNYEIVLINKENNNVIQSVLLKGLQEFTFNNLQEGTEYIIEQRIIKEGISIIKRSFTKATDSSMPPIITYIHMNKNKLTVEVNNKEKLPENAYSFHIYGDNRQPSFQPRNWKWVTLKDTITITVSDSKGNMTTTMLKVRENLTLDCTNLQTPIIVSSSFSVRKSDLIKMISDKYKLSGKLELKKSDDISIDGDIVSFVKTGINIISLYDNEKNKQYDTLFKVMDTIKSGRTIVIQKDMKINFAACFSDVLKREFGDAPYSWSASDNCLIREGHLLRGISKGISQITVKQGSKNMIFYIVVTDKIEEALNMYSITREIIPYAVRMDTRVSLKDALGITSSLDINKDEYKKYLIVETSSPGVSISNGEIIFTAPGTKKLKIINPLTDCIYEIGLDVMKINNEIIAFTDISDPILNKKIDDLQYYGIIAGSSDRLFKPNNNITIKDFLVILNRYMVLYHYKKNELVKNPKLINLTDKDPAYYQAQNLLAALIQEEVDEIFGKDTTLYRSITRKEAVDVLAKTVLRDEYHDYMVDVFYTDISYDEPWVASLMKVMPLKVFKGYEDNTFRPTENIRRAEVIEIMTALYDFFVRK